jgi:hypothetical protein
MSRKVRNVDVNVLKTNSILYYGRVSHIPGAWSPGPVHFARWRLLCCFHHNDCIFLLAHKNMCQFTRIELKTPDYFRVHRSHQNGEFLVQNCFMPSLWLLACEGSL